MNQYKNYIKFKKWDTFLSYTVQEKKFYSAIFNKIELRNKYLLDFGFGTGSLLKWSSDRGAFVYGIEIQKELIDIARKKIGKSDITLYENIRQLSKIKFDIVTLLNVLEHQTKENVPLFLKQIYMNMKNGGILIITIPNCQSPAGFANQFGDPTHLSMLSGPILHEILRATGFKQIYYKSKPIQNSENFLYRLIKKVTLPFQLAFILLYKLTFSIKNTPLGPDVIIFAKK